MNLSLQLDTELFLKINLFLILFLAFIFVVAKILLAIWIYQDAEKRDMFSLPWIIFQIFSSTICLIVYLYSRKPEVENERKVAEKKLFLIGFVTLIVSFILLLGSTTTYLFGYQLNNEEPSYLNNHRYNDDYDDYYDYDDYEDDDLF
ncbi:hypothetical protein [Isobaculum melis]|uniref:Uncharacterized protein n=1 Tax=Isobaculum melis TaxID=142588 RepID=A0A1H9RJE5_9LACT|nr:hypothetical protein [Isobaculum melis]SER72747.1 hypothetical protein SAMN04488559_10484 [Isobaculum melis]